MPHDGPLRITSDSLSVTLNPRVGGTITEITHSKLGLSVLGSVPWDPVDAPIVSFAAPNEPEWLTRYTGGWPLLFPNGGDACTFDGTVHGFHGEASIAPWDVEASAAAVRLARRFFTVPAEMHRELSVEGDLLVIRERIRMTGASPVEAIWCHHATFGSDLLAGPVEITTSGRDLSSEAVYDPPASPLLPGATGQWPTLPGKAAPFDMAHPSGPISSSAYLTGYDGRAWIAMRRLDDAVGMVLSWDEKTFPCAWLWYELGGTPEAPWFGRGNVIGLEPATTMPALGLAEAKRRGGRLLRLEPGTELSTELRLHVFRPTGAIGAVGADGRAVLA